MKMTRSRSVDLAAPRRRLKTTPAVSLWRPEIVLATSINAAPTRRAVVLAGPTARPEALQTQLGATRSLLAGLDGARVTQMITDACPQVKVIALTRHDDAGFVRKLLEAGATGYVLKQSALSELMRGVRAVAAGQQFVDASIRCAVGSSPSDSARAEPAAAPEAGLSLQEQTVLRLVAAAYTLQEIAESLSIDMTDLLATRSAAMAKAGLATRTDVVRYAQAHGWL